MSKLVSKRGNVENSVWVIIPCYNVGEQIVSVIQNIGSEVTGIVAVNDGSKDETLQILESIKSDKRLYVIQNDSNLGVGGSTKRGFEFAFSHGARIAVKLDGDGQMDPRLISALVAPIISGQADYVKGNRFINVDQVISMPKVRLFGNIALSFLTKLSSGYWEIFDPNNGFVAISKKTFELIPTHKVDNRYFFESDMLFRLHLARAVVQDVPMPTKYGTEVSGLKESKAFFEFGYKHHKNFLKRIAIEYYLREFNLGSIQLPMGLVLSLFGGVYGVINFLNYHSRGLPTPTGIQIVVAMSVLSGLQLLLSFFAFDISNSPKKPIS